MLVFLFLCFLTDGGADVIPRQTYTLPPTVKLGLPGSIDFDRQGRLYMVDQLESRVLVWDEKGTFLRHFGEKGMDVDKGGMRNPIKIAVGEERVWVWARNQFMYLFDLAGNFEKPLRFQGVWPKALAVLDKNHTLLGTEILKDDQLEMKVLLAVAESELTEVIGFPNDMLLGINKDDVEKKMTVRAFGPDLDFQCNEKGKWYVGFGDAPFLFSVDPSGNIIGQVPIHLPPQQPDEAEKAYAKSAKFKVWSGQDLPLEDNQTRLRFGPKTGFTQFTLKAGKALFVTTATGGYITDLYPPSERGTYRVMDMADGKIVASGSYSFPPDSKLFFRRGRVIGAIHQADGTYTVSEMALKGWP